MEARVTTRCMLLAVLLGFAATAMASTWYVNGAGRSDAIRACKTIGHAIALAASGDSIRVAAATCTENLTIAASLKVIGSGANTTIIDGGGVARVVTVSSGAAHVIVSDLTLRNGLVGSTVGKGGGIYNAGTLTINNCNIRSNQAKGRDGNSGGGIDNAGDLTVNGSTASQNRAFYISGGGGVYNNASLTIINSTFTGNGAAIGGGIESQAGRTTIKRSTLNANTALNGGAIDNGGALVIINSTLSGNTAAWRWRWC